MCDDAVKDISRYRNNDDEREAATYDEWRDLLLMFGCAKSRTPLTEPGSLLREQFKELRTRIIDRLFERIGAGTRYFEGESECAFPGISRYVGQDIKPGMKLATCIEEGDVSSVWVVAPGYTWSLRGFLDMTCVRIQDIHFFRGVKP